MPEILAPAGAHDSMSAALAAGADAVYFGLDDGFNARARAANFSSDNLAATVAWIHRAGVKAYVTLNTLVFEPELAIVEELIRRVAAAGVDAIIVQDPAVALLARAICPALEVHASTQMTASSPLAAELLRGLGLTRVVVPRELSVDDIRAYAAGTTLPLEVFIHGALCVSWSGQCLSSEAWGGRSANRGQCAQACRLPYDLIVDGADRDLGDVAYLLSPKDLVGLEAVPALAEIGVASLKIEGRLKGPQYVATAVAQYRAAIAAAGGAPVPAAAAQLPIPGDEPALHIAYSRGVSAGFLGGVDHQTLVEGRFPQHRGVPLGRVVEVHRGAVRVVPDPQQRPVTGGLGMPEDPRDPTRGGVNAPALPAATDSRTRIAPRAGMGVVFDRSRPGEREQGGPIFAVTADADAGHWLTFGNPGPDLTQVGAGDRVWISSDPRVARAGDKAAEAGEGPLGRIPVAVVVRGAAGSPIAVTATAPGRDGRQARAELATKTLAAAARGAGLSRDVLSDKLGSFGGTAFHLGSLDTSALAEGLHVPVSELKELRRQLVAQLDEQVARVERTVAGPGVIEGVARELREARAKGIAVADATVVPLCRTDAQLDAVLDAGAREVELDWMELVG
ncbi:MAG TPA: U32 family peptidase, partial [Kofleriaceae bacterium]